MSNVQIKGLNEMLLQLESILGKRQLERIIDKALISGAKIIISELEQNFDQFKDTGASKNEITRTEPRTLNGTRTITIHWQGAKKRWHIIHMNEYGTIKNPNPRGKGAIDRALKSGQRAYFKAVENEIARSLR